MYIESPGEEGGGGGEVFPIMAFWGGPRAAQDFVCFPVHKDIKAIPPPPPPPPPPRSMPSAGLQPRDSESSTLTPPCASTTEPQDSNEHCGVVNHRREHEIAECQFLTPSPRSSAFYLGNASLGTKDYRNMIWNPERATAVPKLKLSQDLFCILYMGLWQNGKRKYTCANQLQIICV